MTKEEKQQAIVDRILEIPLDRWSGNKTDLNGTEIIYVQWSGGFKSHFIVDGFNIYGIGTDGLGDRLQQYREDIQQAERSKKLDELYNNLFPNTQQP